MSFDAATSFYQAPELWKKGLYTNKIDVFSFALVLCEMLVGDYENSTKNPGALAAGVRSDLPDEIRAEMKSMISRCWAQDPDEGRSFAEVLIELKEIEFQILPGVDSRAVWKFLDGIMRKQKERESLPKFRRKGEITKLMESALRPTLTGPAGLEPRAKGKK
jgi:hypothetical protein